MSENKRKNMGKTIAEKLAVIREVHKMNSHFYQHSYKIRIISRLCKVQYFEINEEL